jgi:hypothetical protein
MKQTILKYPLPKVGGNSTTIRLGDNYRVLNVGVQFDGVQDQPRIWIQQDDYREEPEAVWHWVQIRAVHTGVQTRGFGEYIGTAVMDRGTHVTHYFFTTV